jgi:hypothetical protein
MINTESANPVTVTRDGLVQEIFNEPGVQANNKPDSPPQEPCPPMISRRAAMRQLLPGSGKWLTHLLRGVNSILKP